ncbi:HNH endonuclease signature motif containing protein [Catelliglobosispora koreensis]|uniref:HNH endonuclease signature motif containing protein n=1 Tax=Catelliglobosispora koreensis TaxID=129052 RepID=UPI0003670224|nr:HNH endonuclease signature motif containing protein [Catelliglobosispora koreensis]
MFEGVAERIVADGRLASAAAVDRLAEQVRVVARAQGELVRLVHEVVQETPVREFAAFEIAAASAQSRFAAEHEVRLAAELCVRLPAVLAALCAGELGLRHAQVFADVLSSLDGEVAERVAAEVLPKSRGRTCGQLRDMLRGKALAADPAFTTARRQRAHAVRSVQLHAAVDGTASLSAFGLDAVRAAAAFARIGALARARKTGEVSLEQARADVFLELLEGQHSSAASGVVHLDVSLETLAGLDNDPGRLGAYGPVGADIARQWAQSHPGYQWQYAIRDSNGTLLQQGLTRARPATSAAHRDRRPPTQREGSGPAHREEGSGSVRREGSGGAYGDLDGLVRAPGQDPGDRFANAALTRWIRLRDRTCRAPGCRRPTVSCQLDHTIRHHDGGPTHHANLGALCEHHHRAKDQGGWTVVQTRPGHFTWTSPLGRIYEVKPEPP